MMTPQHRTACLQALSDAVAEVAATALGGIDVTPVAPAISPAISPPTARDAASGSETCCGAYLALAAQDEPIQVGLLVDAAGCQILSKALLGMAPADANLPDADVSDAMCEIINIVAGGLKHRVSTELRLVLGLPLFVAGPLLPSREQQLVTRTLKLSEVTVEVLLLTQRDDVPPLSSGGAHIRTHG